METKPVVARDIHESICGVCGMKHFPLKYYRAWIEKYSSGKHEGKKSKYLQMQLEHWQFILDDHPTK